MAQAAPASGWARGKGGGHWHPGLEIGCGHHHWHLNPLQVGSAGESATGGPRHWQGGTDTGRGFTLYPTAQVDGNRRLSTSGNARGRRWQRWRHGNPFTGLPTGRTCWRRCGRRLIPKGRSGC